MKMYAVSLGAGVLVGLFYSLLNVNSPAPPLVALIGLLGILIGEQVIPVGKQMLADTALPVAWCQSKCTQHVFGVPPGRHSDPSENATADSSEKNQ